MNVKLSFLSLAAALLALTGVEVAADSPGVKAKPYPMKTCVVSGEELGKDADMKPHVFNYQGQEVKLCCKGCLKDFNKEPSKYIKKIEEAQKK
jgi:hypothetical protein